MHKLKFIEDKDFSYNEEIIKRLHEYNKSQTGGREKDSRIFYVMDDGILVGACHTKQESDWCHIRKIYYKDPDVLKALMNDVKEYYKDNVVGIQFNSILEDRINDFIALGFDDHGVLKDMAKGMDKVFLLDKDFEEHELDKSYQSTSTKKPIPNYDNKVRKELKKIRKSLDFSTEVVDLQYVVLDGDKFIGGIYGNFQYEYLFINILFVDKKYRGRRIASTLMELIESESARRGVKNIYLTTFEFQALGLYKKRGYKVVMVIEDYPKGFKEYTVYKHI